MNKEKNVPKVQSRNKRLIQSTQNNLFFCQKMKYSWQIKIAQMILKEFVSIIVVV